MYMPEMNKVITDSNELVWTKLPDDSSSYYLPRDGARFIALWNGKVVLCSFNEEEGRFYIMVDPARDLQSIEIQQTKENKFTHYMPLPELPEDYLCPRCASCPKVR